MARSLAKSWQIWDKYTPENSRYQVALLILPVIPALHKEDNHEESGLVNDFIGSWAWTIGKSPSG